MFRYGLVTKYMYEALKLLYPVQACYINFMSIIKKQLYIRNLASIWKKKLRTEKNTPNYIVCIL